MKKGKFYERAFKAFSEHKYNGYEEIKRICKNTFETIVIMTLFTVLSLIFRKIGFHESNVIIVFILGIPDIDGLYVIEKVREFTKAKV